MAVAGLCQSHRTSAQVPSIAARAGGEVRRQFAEGGDGPGCRDVVGRERRISHRNPHGLGGCRPLERLTFTYPISSSCGFGAKRDHKNQNDRPEWKNRKQKPVLGCIEGRGVKPGEQGGA